MDIAAAKEALNGAAPVQDSEFRLIDPAQLTQYWPLIRKGVEAVAERSADGWLPEDVYMALKQGTSQLCVAFVANYYVGFVVLMPSIGWTGPQLHIWACYNRGERDVLQTFLPELVDMARARGATRLTMSSARKGWERRGEALGFHKINSLFAMEL